MTPETESVEHELSLELIVGLLRPYVEARWQATSAKAQQDRLGDLIKNYLERHPGEVAWDGENEIEASFKERAIAGRDCDLNAVYDNARPLFEMLLKNGCLKVDEGAIKKAGALVGGIDKYLAPKRVTTVLNVEEKRAKAPTRKEDNGVD